MLAKDGKEQDDRKIVVVVAVAIVAVATIAIVVAILETRDLDFCLP